jgi:transposase
MHCNETMRKNELYNLVLPLKPKEKTHKIDMLETYGHAVVILPRHTFGLNPIELAWAKIRRSVCENNVTGDLSL